MARNEFMINCFIITITSIYNIFSTNLMNMDAIYIEVGSIKMDFM